MYHHAQFAADAESDAEGGYNLFQNTHTHHRSCSRAGAKKQNESTKQNDGIKKCPISLDIPSADKIFTTHGTGV